MNRDTLGCLSRVDLRDIWTSESMASDPRHRLVPIEAQMYFGEVRT